MPAGLFLYFQNTVITRVYFHSPKLKEKTEILQNAVARYELKLVFVWLCFTILKAILNGKIKSHG